MGVKSKSKRPENLAKLKSKLSSETLMNHGFCIIFLNIIFGVLPITLHKSYISHCCYSMSKVYTTYLIIAMCIASYYFLPVTFEAFFRVQAGVSLTDIIAVCIVRATHVAGYVVLLIRAHWVAKGLPVAWKLLIKAVQHGILEIHGQRWRKWRKLRCFTIKSVVGYLILVLSTQTLFLNSEMFSQIVPLSQKSFLSERHSNGTDVTFWLMAGYLIWDTAALSHVLVSILLNFLVLVVILCLKSVNGLLRKVVAQHMAKEAGTHSESEEKLLLYRLNHVKLVYATLEDFMKNLNVTFGVTIVVEVLVLIGNTLVNLYFIISQLMLGAATEHMYDFGQFFVSVIAHFYFLYKLSVACSEMVNESRRPLRILKDIKYSAHTQAGAAGMNQQISQFLADIGNSSVILSAADYFQVNKFLITTECGLTGRRYTHAQVFGMSRAFSAALLKTGGFQRGDVVAIVSQNSPEYCPAVLGIMEAGLVANPAYTQEEIERQLRSSGAKAVVTSPEFAPGLRAIRDSRNCPELESIIVTGDGGVQDCLSWLEMASGTTGAATAPGVELFTGATCEPRQQTAILPYSSGTTGNPKGVELTHFNLVANCVLAEAPGVSNLKTYQVLPDGHVFQERLLGVLPMFHIFGLMTYLVRALSKGLHVLTLPKFHPESFVKAVRSHRPTALHLVPPLLNFVATCPELGQEELAEVRTLAVGAAPTSEHVVRSFLAKARPGVVFQHGFGMTEVTAECNLLGPAGDKNKHASCGPLLPNMVGKIVDLESGTTLGRKQEGEVCIKGPLVMKGYFKNETATEECLDTESGWLRTGDIGYYDDEGYLFIVGRSKELIKVKGFQVAPAELEGLLREHPGVADAAVFGVPDEAAGELPRAVIVRKGDGDLLTLTEEEVHSFLTPRVVGYKQLKGGVEFVESIPKAASGKVLRRELLQLFQEQKTKS